jgi:hypothetical protein
LPLADSWGSGYSRKLIIINNSTGLLTVTRSGSDTIDGSTEFIVPANYIIHLVVDSSSKWIIINDISKVQQIKNVIDFENYDRSNTEFAIIDQDGRAALKIDQDGNVDLPVFDTDIPERSGTTWGVKDQDGRLAISLNKAGKLYNGFRPVTIDTDLEPLEQRITDLESQVDSIVCWGDSLTYGYPSILSGIIGRTVEGKPVGGQSTSDILSRQGSYGLLLSVDGDEIPASGPVDVTYRSRTPITSQGGGPITGTLGTISGSLSREPDDTYIFTRTESGSATYMHPKALFVPDSFNKENWVNILWTGRNNYFTGVSDLDAARDSVLDGVARFADSMGSNKRWLVLGVTNKADSSEYSGTDIYNSIIELNETLADLYPKHFIDIRRIIIGNYDPLEPQDVIDFSNDVPPDSLRSDTIHFNTDGNTIVANTIADYINLRGY